MGFLNSGKGQATEGLGLPIMKVLGIILLVLLAVGLFFIVSKILSLPTGGQLQ